MIWLVGCWWLVVGSGSGRLDIIGRACRSATAGVEFADSISGAERSPRPTTIIIGAFVGDEASSGGVFVGIGGFDPP